MRYLLLAVAALLVSDALLLTGHGLQLTLLPIRASLEGFTRPEIGLTASAYFIGFVVGCFGTPLLVRRVGHIRSFAVLATSASAVILMYPAFVGLWTWIVLRALTGTCIAGLYMVIESWLNDRASNATRGTILSVYTIVNLTMIMTGQLLLNVGDPAGLGLFVLTSILLSVALIPVSLTTGLVPAPIQTVRIDLGKLWRRSYAACTGSLGAGIATGVFWGVGPVYAYDLGLDTFGVSIFMAGAIAGGAIAQFPLGRLSDRYDRRWVILGAALVAGIMAVGLALPAMLAPASLMPLATLFGAFAMPIYALCVAHASDHAPPEEFVVVGSGVLMLFGIGSAIGAPLAGVLMGPLGPGGAFLLPAVTLFALALILLRRIRTPALAQAEEREPFVAMTGYTPFTVDLDPRAEPHEEEPATKRAGKQAEEHAEDLHAENVRA